MFGNIILRVPQDDNEMVIHYSFQRFFYSSEFIVIQWFSNLYTEGSPNRTDGHSLGIGHKT
jgi:hypothetical protein